MFVEMAGIEDWCFDEPQKPETKIKLAFLYFVYFSEKERKKENSWIFISKKDVYLPKQIHLTLKALLFL
jgi:hypothetical protein